MRRPRPRRPELVEVLVALLVVSLAGIGLAVGFALHNSARIDDQAAGRRQAVAAFCAVDQVIISQGKKALGNYLLPGDRPVVERGRVVRVVEGRFSRALVRLGYPPLAVRRAAAGEAAGDYEEKIAGAVRRAAGVGSGRGPLDCRALVVETTRGG